MKPWLKISLSALAALITAIAAFLWYVAMTDAAASLCGTEGRELLLVHPLHFVIAAELFAFLPKIRGYVYAALIVMFFGTFLLPTLAGWTLAAAALNLFCLLAALAPIEIARRFWREKPSPKQAAVPSGTPEISGTPEFSGTSEISAESTALSSVSADASSPSDEPGKTVPSDENPSFAALWKEAVASLRQNVAAARNPAVAAVVAMALTVLVVGVPAVRLYLRLNGDASNDVPIYFLLLACYRSGFQTIFPAYFLLVGLFIGVAKSRLVTGAIVIVATVAMLILCAR